MVGDKYPFKLTTETFAPKNCFGPLLCCPFLRTQNWWLCAVALQMVYTLRFSLPCLHVGEKCLLWLEIMPGLIVPLYDKGTRCKKTRLPWCVHSLSSVNDNSQIPMVRNYPSHVCRKGLNLVYWPKFFISFIGWFGELSQMNRWENKKPHTASHIHKQELKFRGCLLRGPCRRWVWRGFPWSASPAVITCHLAIELQLDTMWKLPLGFFHVCTIS